MRQPLLPECPALFHLNAFEVNHPQTVLAAFFDFATAPEARHCLAEWLAASFYAQDNRQADYIHLYQELVKLVEACWLLHHSRASGTNP